MECTFCGKESDKDFRMIEGYAVPYDHTECEKELTYDEYMLIYEEGRDL